MGDFCIRGITKSYKILTIVKKNIEITDVVSEIFPNLWLGLTDTLS